MKKLLALSLVLAVAMSGTAMAKVKKGKITQFPDGTWGCVGPGGEIIPPNSSGGWIVVNPPKAIGGGCTGGALVRGSSTSFSPKAEGPVRTKDLKAEPDAATQAAPAPALKK